MKKKVFSIVAGLFLIAGMAVFVPQVKAGSAGMGHCIWASCIGTWCHPAFADTQLAIDMIDALDVCY